ncbi:hypothetical protein Murmansk-157 [Murmansk poxvirus]|uniref:Chemokine binding protein n=1 Tax=Murmansk poxvirus TaxID=2025359 RepID=A0A223FN09_9POXV|nr:hypothetical protein CKM52_gp157 [Murmansk poxvirus]AST09352.1 hypothetical protein Murmansk-157 [Murmansk poxvirus]
MDKNVVLFTIALFIPFCVLTTSTLNGDMTENHMDRVVSVCSDDKEHIGIELYVNAKLRRYAIKNTNCDTEIHEGGASIHVKGVNISVELSNCFANFTTVGQVTTKRGIYTRFANDLPWKTNGTNMSEMIKNCYVTITVNCDVPNTSNKKFFKKPILVADISADDNDNITIKSILEINLDNCIQSINGLHAYLKLFDTCASVKQNNTIIPPYNLYTSNNIRIYYSNEYETCQ